jgi:hypothetical protein
MSTLSGLPRRKASDPPTGDWLALSRDLTELSTALSGRPDLVVRIAPGLGQGSPACFIHGEAMVEINGDLLEVRASEAMPFLLSNRDKWPSIWGALVHECAHARCTRWKPREWMVKGLPAGIKAEWVSAAALMEEPRIEQRQADYRPGDRYWMRAAVRRWLLADTEDGTDQNSGQVACRVMTLVGGRVAAGILDPEEAAKVLRSAEDVLVCAAGQPHAGRQLQALTEEFLQIGDEDTDAALDLGRRWCEIAARCKTPQDKEKERLAQALADALDELCKEIGKGMAGEPPRSADARERELRREARKAADRVFRGTEGRPKRENGYGFSISEGYVHGEVGWRAPAPAERAGARQLASALRRASVRERAATVVSSALPPGRPMMRDSLQRDAEIAAGAVPVAEPWRRVQRMGTPTPPLRVAILCDVSGSMTHWVHVASSIAWQLSEAVALLPDARSTLVAFGETAYPVIRPRVRRENVPVLPANAGHERFCLAVDAADHELGLSVLGNARLLVVVSDAVYGMSGEAVGAAIRVRRLMERGCRVIWLDDIRSAQYETGSGYQRPVLRLPGLHHIVLDGAHKDSAAKATAAVLGGVLKVMRDSDGRKR